MSESSTRNDRPNTLPPRNNSGAPPRRFLWASFLPSFCQTPSLCRRMSRLFPRRFSTLSDRLEHQQHRAPRMLVRRKPIQHALHQTHRAVGSPHPVVSLGVDQATTEAFHLPDYFISPNDVDGIRIVHQLPMEHVRLLYAKKR